MLTLTNKPVLGHALSEGDRLCLECGAYQAALAEPCPVDIDDQEIAEAFYYIHDIPECQACGDRGCSYCEPY